MFYMFINCFCSFCCNIVLIILMITISILLTVCSMIYEFSSFVQINYNLQKIFLYSQWITILIDFIFSLFAPLIFTIYFHHKSCKSINKAIKRFRSNSMDNQILLKKKAIKKLIFGSIIKSLVTGTIFITSFLHVFMLYFKVHDSVYLFIMIIFGYSSMVSRASIPVILPIFFC